MSERKYGALTLSWPKSLCKHDTRCRQLSTPPPPDESVTGQFRCQYSSVKINEWMSQERNEKMTVIYEKAFHTQVSGTLAGRTKQCDAVRRLTFCPSVTLVHPAALSLRSALQATRTMFELDAFSSMSLIQFSVTLPRVVEELTL